MKKLKNPGKLIMSVGFILFLSIPVIRAENTTYLNLEKIPAGTTDWHLNEWANMDKIDAAVGPEHNTDGTHKTIHADDIVTKGPWVDARAYNNGAFNDTTITAALTAIGTSKRTLLLAPGTWAISNNITIPSNVNLRSEQGAVLNISTGITVTVDGSFEAGLYQVFDGDGSVVFGSGSVEAIFPEWWGADSSDGSSDYTALAKAISSLSEGMTLKLSKGLYRTGSNELSLNGKSHITIEGTGFQGSRIHSNGSNIRSVLSLLGARFVTLRNLEIYSGNPTNSPDAVVILGRTSPSSFGNHRFERVSIRGFASKALVYSIASEVNSFDNVYFTLDGGGAKYVFYTSQEDDLGLGGFTSSTNLSTFFHHFRFYSGVTNEPDAANIFIRGAGSSKDIYFRDGYIGSKSGSHVRFEVKDQNASGPYVFDSIRAEQVAGGAVDYGFYFGTIGTANSIQGLSVRNCNFTVLGTNFMYAEDGITLYSGILENNHAFTGSSLYNGSQLFIKENYGNITFRRGLRGSVAFVQSTYTFDPGLYSERIFVISGNAGAGTALFKHLKAEFIGRDNQGQAVAKFQQNDLDQAGIYIDHNKAGASGEIMKIDGWQAADGSANISSGSPTGTTKKQIKVNINGTDYWIEAKTWN